MRLKHGWRRFPALSTSIRACKADKPIVAIDVKRELASDLGVGVADIGTALRPLLSGDAISTWRAPDDQDYDVQRALAALAAAQDVDDLAKLMIATNRTDANGAPVLVPLRQVADIVKTTGPDVLNRRDLQREVMLSANVNGRSPGEVAADVAKTLDAMHLPAGYHYRFEGSTKSMNESFVYAVEALALAVIFIYMILASQFASFAQPLAIMASLPLTLDWRADCAAAVRQYVEHVLDHRLRHADGPGDEERDFADRLRESGSARHPARRVRQGSRRWSGVKRCSKRRGCVCGRF